MSSKYVDTSASLQVIGNILKTPSLLENDKYWFNEEDFPIELHRIVFGSIYQLYNQGIKTLSLESIADFLSTRPHNQAIFNEGKGEEMIIKCAETAQTNAFDFYYNRLKKMTLLRQYDLVGMDISDFYDIDNILDIKKKERQENWLDNSSLEQIADSIDAKISNIRQKYVSENFSETNQAGDNITSLIEKYKTCPEVGIPLYGPLINTVTRGARLKKLYLRSAPSGVGKTRANVADACYFACNKIYDENFGWISNGVQNPTLFIATEQELDEIQTLMLSFISNVNEEHILNGKYELEEEVRVLKAAEIIKNSPLYVTTIPDFSIKDIENAIKNGIREHGVGYVVFDYIHTSMKILEEVTRRSGGVKLREDNILFMLSTKLKDLCNIYGVFLITSTQLNADWKESKSPDQNLLRGAKAIADKIDYGSHLLPISEDDVKSLGGVIASFPTVPNLKISVYKNRRGRYKGIYLWCNADLGTCRIRPMFATTWSYELISIDDVQVEVNEPSAF